MAKKRTFSCRTNTGNPKWLALSGSQWECRIHFILPARGFSHVIRLSGLIHLKIMLVLAFKAISQSPQKVVISKWFYNIKRLWLENFSAIKGPVSFGSPVLLVLFCQYYSPSIAMELKVGKEITYKIMTKSEIIRDKQICPLSIILEAANSRNTLWKTVRLNSFQKP